MPKRRDPASLPRHGELYLSEYVSREAERLGCKATWAYIQVRHRLRPEYEALTFRQYNRRVIFVSPPPKAAGYRNANV